MQIQCPHCSTRLQLGVVRPGSYKPTCTRCHKPFLLKVSSDVPPKVKTAALKTPDPARTSAEETGAEETGAQTVAASASRPSSRRKESPPVAAERSARVAAESQSSPEATIESGELPSRLGGYRIVRLIGRGAMGSVYQAKQISLDRDVALKTIRSRLSENPASLARFAREAYAAAQLTHHNVVQIYDFGQDDGQHYFSMEWVRGGSLGDLVREKGSLDPKLAATYVLQAARGLQFAHRNGMVHRDVKPTNLLLSDEGVVKLADLGLVKVPDLVEQQDADAEIEDRLLSGLQSGTQVTMQGTAVGTPAYMAPEQGNDSSSVDHRADIYSLGCTMFYLLAGRSPYDGTVISEVLEQHATAPVPDLAEINSRVPKPLCDIVARAMAKRPSDRYTSVAEMIDDLQEFLGIESLMGFSPTTGQADRWETIAKAYAKTQFLRQHGEAVFWTFAVISILATVGVTFLSPRSVLFGPFLFATGCVVALAMSTLVRHNALVDRFRGWLGTLSWIEVGGAAFAIIVSILAIFISGLWIGMLGGVIAGAIAGVIYHFAVTFASAKSGARAMEDARRFVRDLRIAGAEESGLRDFLARYAGKHWQTTYEDLFGYDAMSEIRQRLATDSSFQGNTDARSVRDRLCRRLGRMTKSNRDERDRKQLARIEQRSLISQGVSPDEARQQSWQMASAIMGSAQVSIRQNPTDAKAAAKAKRDRVRAMLADARSGKYKRPRDRYAALKFAFSGFTRLLVGCLLLAVFAFAAQSTGLFSEQLLDDVRRGEFDLESISGDAQVAALGDSKSVWSIGLAGLLLCLSAFVSGWKMTPFAAAATLVILFGASLGLPAIGPAAPWMVAAGVGLLIYIPGILLGES